MGEAVAFGEQDYGQCNVPPLPEGLQYVNAACGHYHTILVRNDGHVMAFGRNSQGQAEAPDLSGGERCVATPAAEPCVAITMHAKGASTLSAGDADAKATVKVTFNHVSGEEIDSLLLDKGLVLLGGIRLMLCQRLQVPIWRLRLL